MTLFNWKAKPKPRETGNPGKVGSVAGPDEIDRAAMETESAAGPSSQASYQPDAGSADTFTITPDIAVAMVKGCFSPLVKYDHPAWEVTDEEAAPIVPKMQAAIQAVLDRHMPQFMISMMNKYPEMLGLTYAMAMLYYVKFKAVRLVRMEEHRDEQRRIVESRKAEAERKAAEPLIYQPERPDMPLDAIAGKALDLEPPPPSI
jgi:hypothetical protein